MSLSLPGMIYDGGPVNGGLATAAMIYRFEVPGRMMLNIRMIAAADFRPVESV